MMNVIKSSHRIWPYDFHNSMWNAIGNKLSEGLRRKLNRASDDKLSLITRFDSFFVDSIED